MVEKQYEDERTGSHLHASSIMHKEINKRTICTDRADTHVSSSWALKMGPCIIFFFLLYFIVIGSRCVCLCVCVSVSCIYMLIVYMVMAVMNWKIACALLFVVVAFVVVVLLFGCIV